VPTSKGWNRFAWIILRICSGFIDSALILGLDSDRPIKE
jgi:hypothetical protein